MCGRGLRAARNCFWVAWGICCFPFMVIQSWLLCLPSRLLLTMVHLEWASLLTGAFMGYLYASVVFLPLARWASVPETQTPLSVTSVCVSYLGTLSWVAGQLVVGSLVYAGYINQFSLYDQITRCKSQYATPERPAWMHLWTLSPTAFMGVLLGLLYAFPILTMQPVYLENNSIVVTYEWCQSSEQDSVPLSVIYLLAFLIGVGCAAASVDQIIPISLHRVTKHLTEGQRQNQLHTVVALHQPVVQLGTPVTREAAWETVADAYDVAYGQMGAVSSGSQTRKRRQDNSDLTDDEELEVPVD